MVVLRLTSSGIERTATVSRRDPAAGTADLMFDTLSGLPVSGEDSPVELRLTYDMEPESETLVALSQVLINLDRLIVRVTPASELPRVAELSKSSPLEIVLYGGVGLTTLGSFLKKAMEVRLAYYQGSKARAESEGVELDNFQKRRLIESEADQKLLADVNASEEEESSELLKQLATRELQPGEPGSLNRRQFLESARAAIALPFGLIAEVAVRRSDSEDGGF